MHMYLIDFIVQQRPIQHCKAIMKKVKVQSLTHIGPFATPWTVAHQAPLSMGFSRQEYWSGLPLPSPGCLPDPGIESGSPALQADSLLSEPPRKPKPRNTVNLEPVFQVSSLD